MKQNRSLIYLTFYWCCLLYACGPSSSGETEKNTPAVTVSTNSDSLAILKTVAKEGDLVVRLTDDLVSYHIRHLSVEDPAYSHAGIITMRNGALTVCHIYPHEEGADTVLYEPIDSFLNPSKNLTCALYRYDLNEKEKSGFITELNQYAARKIHFDKFYDLRTEDKVYCSEMIYKSLKKATNNRIIVKDTPIPENMLPSVYKYFEKENASRKEIAARRLISIDQLYLMPQSTKIMQFTLKHLPGGS